MATTSFVYHTFGIRGYQHHRTEYRKGSAFHHIELRDDKRRCRGCGARRHELTLEGRFERTFRALPVGRRRQFIVLHGHEQKCRRCKRKLREPISFAEGKSRHIRAFERFVVDLCRIATIKHVANFLGVGWSLVKEIFKRYLRRKLKKLSLRRVRYIAVDEFSIYTGQQYMTVVLVLETGQVLHAVEGRSSDDLKPFFRRLKAAHAKLRAIAMDMWPAYLLAAAEELPKAPVVHDRYHIVALANEAIDETRREICSTLSKEDRKQLKGARFLLLKGGERLDDQGLSYLSRLESLNQSLYRGYLLKEDLRRLWLMPSKRKAKRFLNSWIRRAKASELKQFVKLAKTLDRHRRGVLAYFNHRITTGPLEGLNNKIKVLKRQAYGFRDIEYFKLRLAFIHEDTPAFAG